MANYIPKGEDNSKMNFKEEKPKKELLESEILPQNSDLSVATVMKKTKGKRLIAGMLGTTVAAGLIAGMITLSTKGNINFNGPYSSDIGKQISKTVEYKQAKNEYLKDHYLERLDASKQVKEFYSATKSGQFTAVTQVRYSFIMNNDLYVYYFLSDQWKRIVLFKYSLSDDLVKDFVNSQDIFDYQYLLDYVINNYQGELFADNYFASLTGLNFSYSSDGTDASKADYLYGLFRKEGDKYVVYAFSEKHDSNSSNPYNNVDAGFYSFVVDEEYVKMRNGHFHTSSNGIFINPFGGSGGAEAKKMGDDIDPKDNIFTMRTQVMLDNVYKIGNISILSSGNQLYRNKGADLELTK